MFGGGFGQQQQQQPNQSSSNQGQQSAAPAPAATGFSFGGFGASQGTTPQAQNGGLFGANFAATGGVASGSKPTQSLFGAPAQSQAPAPASNSGFSFGNTGASTQQPPSSLFGAPPAGTSSTPAGTSSTPAANAAPTQSLFGSAATPASTAPSFTTQSTSLFGASGSGSAPSFGGAAANQPKPSLFGGGAPAAANPNPTTPAPKPALFGAAPASSTLTTTAPAATLPTSSLFGAKPLAAAPSTTSAPTAPTTSLFGAASTTAANGSTLAPAAATFASAGPLKVDDLGKLCKTPAKPSIGGLAASTATSNPIGSTAATNKATAASSLPATGSLSVLKNKSVEVILHKWSTELDNYTREFQKQAIQIQKWDQAIVSNGALVTQLFNELQDVEGCEKEIDQNLEYIEAQQTELETSLETFASQIQSIITQDQANPNSRFRSTPADEDREKAYVLAEHLNTKLDDMASSLSIVINELNTARKKGDSSSSSNAAGSSMDESPLESITQILNAHLTSLEWIERSSGKLEAKVERLKGLEKQVAGKVLNR